MYQHTLTRYEAIREAGYELIVQWECKWQNFKEECEDMRGFEQGLRIVLRLEPRDAFIGGRTEAIQLHADTEEDEEIRYLDFTSLYPFVNKNCGYPIGHPRIITKPSSPDISSYFGLVSCTILQTCRIVSSRSSLSNWRKINLSFVQPLRGKAAPQVHIQSYSLLSPYRHRTSLERHLVHPRIGRSFDVRMLTSQSS